MADVVLDIGRPLGGFFNRIPLLIQWNPQSLAAISPNKTYRYRAYHPYIVTESHKRRGGEINFNERHRETGSFATARELAVFLLNQKKFSSLSKETLIIKDSRFVLNRILRAWKNQ